MWIRSSDGVKNWENELFHNKIALLDKNLSKHGAHRGKSNKRDPWWWKGWKSLASTSGCQSLAAESKPMTTESWDYWHLTPLMWFLLEKQTCSLPGFLKCYTLTGLQSAIHWWTGLFWMVVCCVVVPVVKEHFRGSIGLLEIYEVMLLLDRRTAPCNLQGWNKLSSPFSFSSIAFIPELWEHMFHEQAGNRLRTTIGYKQRRRDPVGWGGMEEEVWKWPGLRISSTLPTVWKSFLEVVEERGLKNLEERGAEVSRQRSKSQRYWSPSLHLKSF